jgi:hypothetical protein
LHDEFPVRNDGLLTPEVPVSLDFAINMPSHIGTKWVLLADIVPSYGVARNMEELG